jgi:hypothetical protein
MQPGRLPLLLLKVSVRSSSASLTDYFVTARLCSVAVRLRGCAAAWLRGCCVALRGCMAAWLRDCVAARWCGFVLIMVHGFRTVLVRAALFRDGTE